MPNHELTEAKEAKTATEQAYYDYLIAENLRGNQILQDLPETFQSLFKRIYNEKQENELEQSNFVGTLQRLKEKLMKDLMAKRLKIETVESIVDVVIQLVGAIHQPDPYKRSDWIGYFTRFTQNFLPPAKETIGEVITNAGVRPGWKIILGELVRDAVAMIQVTPVYQVVGLSRKYLSQKSLTEERETLRKRAISEERFDKAWELIDTPEKRARLNTDLDKEFKDIYELLAGKQIFGASLKPLIFASTHGGFQIQNAEGDTVCEALLKEGKTEALRFLLMYYRYHFSRNDLAFMGVGRDELEIEYWRAKENSGEVADIAKHYARGGHEARLAEIRQFVSAEDWEGVLEGYIWGNKPAEASRFVELHGFSEIRLEMGLYEGRYFQDPQKLVQLLAGSSPKLRKGLVDAASSMPFPLLKFEKAVKDNIQFYEELAIHKKLPVPADILKLPLRWDEWIEEHESLASPPLPETQDFINALRTVKQQLLTDYVSGVRNEEEVRTMATATAKLIAALKVPATAEQAVKNFEAETIHFQKNPLWKMILGALIGAVLGFIAGVLLAAALGPIGAAAAFALTAKGAVIGASCFGGVGLFAGGALMYRQDPVAGVVSVARAMIPK